MVKEETKRFVVKDEATETQEIVFDEVEGKKQTAFNLLSYIANKLDEIYEKVK